MWHLTTYFKDCTPPVIRKRERERERVLKKSGSEAFKISVIVPINTAR
jgi:hypothetical protein